MDSLPPHELSRLEAVAGPDRPLEDLVRQRLEGEPLQYLEGSAAFGPVEVLVDQRVLVPRPETEGILEIALKMVRFPEIVVDLCTGSGALALALKHRFPSSSVFATDVSQDALDLAGENCLRNDLEIYLAQGDLFDPLPAALIGQVDLMVSNPPYVAEGDFDTLPRDVQREPRIALIAGPTGLEVINRIGEGCARWLRPGGVVICEIGETQGSAATAAFTGVSAVVRPDVTGRDRYIVGVKP